MVQLASEEVSSQLRLAVRLFARRLGYNQGANGWPLRPWSMADFATFCRQYSPDISEEDIVEQYEVHRRLVCRGFTCGSNFFGVRLLRTS